MTAKITPKKADEWQPIFLLTFRETGNVRASCETAGISRLTAYKAKDKSPEFAEHWAEALADAIDTLEAEAVRRAKTTSDVLLIFLLKAHRPDLYRETVNLRIERERILEDTRKLAAEKGLDPNAAVAEVEAILRGR